MQLSRLPAAIVHIYRSFFFVHQFWDICGGVLVHPTASKSPVSFSPAKDVDLLLYFVCSCFPYSALENCFRPSAIGIRDRNASRHTQNALVVVGDFILRADTHQGCQSPMSAMDPGDVATTSEQSVEEPNLIAELKIKHARERQGLALTKQPLLTLKLFSKSLSRRREHLRTYVASHRLSFLLALSFAVLVGITMYFTDGPHKVYVKESLAWARYVVWWVALGVASSIGLGSGLHTFVMYLGPHVAMFTMRATQCGRVDLKCAPYDTAQWGLAPSWAFKNCPQIGDPVYPRLASESERYMVPLHSVLLQVQLEAVLWGIGTALGELPPYFMSRQARLAGERLREPDELISSGDTANSLFDRVKLWMVNHINNFGFFTILLFASVPNPLFDMAGILCGQFLVPFWKFFAATLIGKALIKTHIQVTFIIMVSNPYVVELIGLVLSWLIDLLPAFAHLTPSITAALENAKSKFSNGNSAVTKVPKGNMLAFTWNTIVFMMMMGFMVSIVTSIAQGVLVEQQRCELEALESRSRELLPSSNNRHDRNE